MEKLTFEDKILEPDLICSKDGDVLGRSHREAVRAYGEVFAFCIPRILSMFGKRFR